MKRRATRDRAREETRFLAAHEAGHAVAYSFFLGSGYIAKVTIVPNRVFAGHVYPDPRAARRFGAFLEAAPQGRRRGALGCLALGIYAGPAAELVLDPKSENARECFSRVGPKETAVVDEWMRDKAALLAVKGRLDDLSHVEMALSAMSPGDLRARARMRKYLRREAHAFVAEHWVEIETLASALLRRRTLTGVQAARVLRYARRRVALLASTSKLSSVTAPGAPSSARSNGEQAAQ